MVLDRGCFKVLPAVIPAIIARSWWVDNRLLSLRAPWRIGITGSLLQVLPSPSPQAAAETTTAATGIAFAVAGIAGASSLAGITRPTVVVACGSSAAALAGITGAAIVVASGSDAATLAGITRAVAADV